MNEKRKGEIALLFLKLKLKDKGILIDKNIEKEVDRLAVSVGLDPEESAEFIEIIIREIIDEIFAPHFKDSKHHISSS